MSQSIIVGMKIKLCLFFFVTTVAAYGQEMNFIKTSERKLDESSWEYIYRVELFNNTGSPICIPISMSAFGLVADLRDTIEVSSIYPAIDTAFIFSFYYQKSDVEGSSTRYRALPVIINPNTYFLTNVKFTLKKKSAVFLELKLSSDKSIDYSKIKSSFESSPGYVWMNMLTFSDKRYKLF